MFVFKSDILFPLTFSKGVRMYTTVYDSVRQCTIVYDSVQIIEIFNLKYIFYEYYHI